SPRTVPARLARFGPLPESEVTWVALLVADLDAGAGLQLFGVAVAEFAILGIAADVKVDVTPGRVSVALGDQALNHLNDGADELGGTRHVIDAGDAEPLKVALIVGGDARG